MTPPTAPPTLDPPGEGAEPSSVVESLVVERVPFVVPAGLPEECGGPAVDCCVAMGSDGMLQKGRFYGIIACMQMTQLSPLK